jgi:hypothetical protein
MRMRALRGKVFSSAMTTRGFGAYAALAPRGLVLVALVSVGCVPAALTLGPTVDDASDDASDAADVAVDSSLCAGDTCCDSGNPGACAAGLRVASGGLAACVPLASTQPCYTGAVVTRDVGACHAGTQSCVGSLGPCTGEVTPARIENCFNTIDDDCDGVVNNGCPSSLLLGPGHSLLGAGGDGGGTATARCPPGSFVTRVDSWGNGDSHHASGVSFWCSTPALVRGTSAYSVTLTQTDAAPAQLLGMQDASVGRRDDCSGLTGPAGFTAITYTVGRADDAVEALGNHCATTAVTLQPDDTITFDFKGDGGMDYATWGDGGAFFDAMCGPTEVVVGFVVHNGAWLDHIAPICAQLTVVPM